MTKNEALKSALKVLEVFADRYSDGDEAIIAIKEALQHPWVSLTEEQKDSLLLPFSSYKVIDVIEAMLKEKNGV